MTLPPRHAVSLPAVPREYISSASQTSGRCFCSLSPRRPGYEECGDITTSTIVKDDVETYQSCGSRGLEPCPDGTVCLDDPTVDNCGQACDIPGYCVPDVSCGGFIGKACPVEGQLCPDDPRDECDPLQGGSDCEGLCFTPQSAV